METASLRFFAARSRFRISLPVTFRLAVAACLTVVASELPAQQGAQSGQDEVISEAKAATVTLRIASARGFASANGFIASDNGIIVTTEHVLANASAVEVRLASGETFVAKGVLHADPALDLALLKIDAAGLPALPLGNSDDVEAGQPLMLVTPAGSDVTVTNGTLSGSQQVRGRKFFRLQVPTSADNVGSPVVISSGKVIGMVVAGIREQASGTLSYAVPISYVRQMIPTVMGRHAVPFATRSLAQPPTTSSLTRSAPTDVPNVVNASIEIDWASLAGAESSVEEFRSGEYERTTTVRYSMSTDVAGKPALEKEVSQRTRVPDPQATYSKIDYTRLDARAVTRLDGTKIELFAQMTPVSEHARKLNASVDITFADTVVSLTSSTRKPFSMWIPFGVIPSQMRHDALAAMPDSLPDQVFLWTAEVDTTASRVMPVRFRIGRATTMKVPFARDGHSCADGKVKSTKVRVRPVTETTGALTATYFVLASKPHLRVEEIKTTCVRLPPGPQARQAP